MVQRADVKISNIHSALAMQLSLQNNRNLELETLANFFYPVVTGFHVDHKKTMKSSMIY